MSKALLTTTPTTTRLASIDALRGLVMVIMALDHVRDFFTNAPFSPTDLGQTSPALFLTRWVTHYCAPVFVFLAGTGAGLARLSGKTAPSLARFLVSRGLWLVALELTVVRFAWVFNLNYRASVAQVIWAIGWSMVLLAPLVFRSMRAAGLFGVLLVATHNLLDRTEVAGRAAALYTVLHQPGPVAIDGAHRLYIAYPLLPWVGVMAAGYGFAAIVTLPERERRRALVGFGGALIAGFALLRLANGYGDPRPWAPQQSAIFTLLSFLNCTKYPPSLDYLMMTLGPALLVLALFERLPARWLSPLVVFGRVPLFYYVLHLFLIHAIALAVSYLHRGRLFDSLLGGAGFPGSIPPAVGYGLGVVYLVWALVVLALYAPCVWYAALKARNKSPWLSYL